MAYCGCGTKANKARWCAVFVLLALAVVFLIVNIVVSRDCRVCTTESVNGSSTHMCKDPGYEADRDWDGTPPPPCPAGFVASLYCRYKG